MDLTKQDKNLCNKIILDHDTLIPFFLFSDIYSNIKSDIFIKYDYLTELEYCVSKENHD